MRLSSIVALALWMAALAGCGYSTSPLSDAKTSVLDTDLIGTWEFEKDTRERSRVHIGLKRGSSKELEVVIVGLDKQVVRVRRLELRPTRIGDALYLSIRYAGDDGEKKKPAIWIPLRYHVIDGRLHVEILDLERTSQAIAAGDIGGSVEEVNVSALVAQAVGSVLQALGLDAPKKPEKPAGRPEPIQIPCLTASTDELRKWIEGSGKRCFRPVQDGEGVLRRTGSYVR